MTDVEPLNDPPDGPQRVESFAMSGRQLVRRVARRDGTVAETDFGLLAKEPSGDDNLHALADGLFLRSTVAPQWSNGDSSLAIADLFSGIGSLSLGVLEAARAIGRDAEIVLAADDDPIPLEVLAASLGPAKGATRCIDLDAVLSGTADQPTPGERALLGDCPAEIDVLVAGPPCQGHSRLNNHTRHDDPRNDLYGSVARFVELKRPRLCIVENVDSIVSDQRRSAATVAETLGAMSYRVSTGTVALHRLGVAQARRRHVMVATRADQATLEIDRVVDTLAVEDPAHRTVRWAIEDLLELGEREGADQPSRPSKANARRMAWLHDQGRYDLPNEQRPDCHRLPKVLESGNAREHSYRSMYGRLDWDKPAQTITSGYGSMGQGRYVHPDAARTLTPHEAARLQFVPDFFDFGKVTGRGRWARMIGNVAPLKLSYVLALEFLR
jgi:DNA (cytosine-5)-methyltransferase 1